MDQYGEVKKKFGEDRGITIYNEKTISNDKYFIVNKIDESLEDVLMHFEELIGKNQFKPFESIEEINQPLDNNRRVALDLLRQIKEFYDLSIEHGIDTDIHVGNFRLVKDAHNNYKLVLTDFRESLEEEGLLSNKVIYL